MSLISVQRADGYDPAGMKAAVEAHFAALEVEKDLFPGMKVLLKPNLLAARRPEQAVTTHPALIQAVIDWLRERGVENILLADSPGGLYNEARLRAVYAAGGMDRLRGVTLDLAAGSAPVDQPRGKVCRRFDIIDPIRRADYIINLPKVKTHGMTVVSLGVKNLFGAVPGLEKPALHCRYPGWEAFAGMLLDLAELVAPAITLADGVIAMEGDGPAGGTTRQLGYTFASRDIYSLDWFLADRVMGIPPRQVPMLRQAKERGLVEETPALTGDPLGEIPPFARPKSQSADFADRLPGFLRAPAKALLGGLFRPKPRVDKALCVGCGRCAESCPQKIITLAQGKAVIDTRRCISCFCCQEMCPVKAITAKRGFSSGG